MKSATIAIFGNPIPTAMLPLAKAVDEAITEAEQSTDAVPGEVEVLGPGLAVAPSANYWRSPDTSLKTLGGCRGPARAPPDRPWPGATQQRWPARRAC